MKRIKDVKFRNEIKKMPCVVCGALPSDAHHIKTVGSGGTDDSWNLASLCRWCHSKLHQQGQLRFYKENENYKNYINKLGWFESFGKLRNKNYEKK